ncbi:hypothetical protein [Clostridium beijerinckii]|uniref:hypothetical protein n=1 Tax=Clostridium beijerinckii TaxID=1520 RepID=UPI000809A076|nr:hypothetical protein [Clostridium beijerinckii]OCA97600.1 hypothetical protein BGS1_20550 [Clostridium beijerinckii]
MKSIIRYNLKLLFSPLKWLSSFIFICLISIFMYAPTYYDFTNICELYMPFIGIILITDIMLVDKHNNISEILYISNSNLKKVFLIRYFIVGALIAVFILIANSIFLVQGYFEGQSYLNEPITSLEFLVISVVSTLFLGTVSMTIGNFLSNQYVAYGFSLMYWLYWNINCKKQSIFNLFPFIAKPTDYVTYIVIEIGSILCLLFINSILVQKSPFFIVDRLLNLKSIIHFMRNN